MPMDLSVPVKNVPFGILALIHSNAQLEESIKVVSGQTDIQLAVAGHQLVGSPAVARFLIRQGQLLDEQLPQNQYQAQLIDAILSGQNIVPLVEASQTTFLTGNDVSIVDYLAWDVLRSADKPSSKVADYIKAVNATAAATEAVKQADQLSQSAAPAKIDAIPEIPNTVSNPSGNPMDVFRNLIAVQLAQLAKVDAALIYDALDLPRSLEHGDLAVAIPRLRLKGNPVAIAKELAEAFVPNDYITGAVAVGPFLNFKLNLGILRRLTIEMVSDKAEGYGRNNSGAGKTVIVEFSSPNIAKPFHAGHLRSTIIGAFVRNVYDANGWKSIAMNYLGDWGKQYGLLAVGFARHGSEEKLLSDPIKHLYDVYVQINRDAEENPAIHDEARAYFKKMEDGDESALALWRRFRDLSIVKYKEVYGRLNIHFDVYSGESQVGEGMERAMKVLESCGLLQESEGAKVIDLKKYKLGTTVVQKSDGTTLYLTRDIGAAMERHEKYNFDKMIYVVASQQELHLKQLFKTLELMGFEWANKVEHVSFGLVQGMSTRKGTVVFLEDILNEAKDIMHEVMRKNEKKYQEIEDPEMVADNIGLSAVKIQDNAARRIKNYEFDRNRMFTFEGDTGPYIQYAHARLCSIERKSGREVNFKANIELLTEKGAIEVLRTVAQYPDLVRSLMNGYEPCNVVTYSFKLAHDISAVFDQLWVQGAADDVADARLLMYWSARVTLGNAMRLLNLKPLQRM
ncbi:uncharacterized protein BYT42DRAFT_539504 [Radiomyces spectabilis]|uniref:uncharacterized protein n=1 Tax=Radiomyces spectabilis TaxID=64574 RepID=UPI002220B5EB|nr:uncharacterized protein BYT42DRAFT_539504 [Radiomyces spectabilis]KAI8368287.1 hypothetical protein BYT42DRAFT_539504 [Radiomyces spectabilis]